METDDFPTDTTPVHLNLKPAARDSKNRPMVLFKNRRMTYSAAQRIATLEPLIMRANYKKMSIPRAASWLGYSKSAVFKWIKILGIKWKIRNHRPKHIINRDGWHDAIVAGIKMGKTQSQMAKELNTKNHNISRFIKSAGLRAYGRKVKRK